jgi:hypothetical protein
MAGTMTTLAEDLAAAIDVEAAVDALDEATQSPEYVIVCLSSLSVHVNGQPFFGCKVYGPFAESDLVGVHREIQRLEGGACLVRPLVDLDDTYRRISAD